MSASLLCSPHDSLLAFAERAACAGFDAVANGARGATFDDFAAWIGDADPSLPLRRVTTGFALEPPESALLALLFAVALSEPVARHVAAVAAGGQGIPLWLAHRLIPDLRGDTLAVTGALRRFGLVEVEHGVLRIESRVWLREPVLDRFCGAPAYESEVLARIVPTPVNELLANEHLTRQLKTALAVRGDDQLSPLVFAGTVEAAMVAASLAALGLRPHVLTALNVPEEPDARDRIARMWSRDAALDSAALIIAFDERCGTAAADFADRVAGHVVIVGHRPAIEFRRAIRILTNASNTPASAADRWRRALGSRVLKVGAGLTRVASQFKLSPAEIDALCARVAPELDAAGDEHEAAQILWHAAGRVVPAVLVPGVSVVEPVYRWGDIILAPAIETALRRIETHVRHATTVIDDWGFGERMGGRGRGVAALFAGPSGTGKTMAAEVLASSLDLRMMVIDLSQIISKYVGETSKNIAAAFEQAERTGAVMVWNEGDAIWGARGTVGNATDRHVNAEIGDLLQRIESFRGFTIVTTNMRQAIDPAFLRRFRFAIDFPMPSESERLRLWQQVFPEKAPIERINWRALAALPLSGGSIRNVALGSAFMAAEGGKRIDAQVIAVELAEELRKHDQPMPAINWGAHA